MQEFGFIEEDNANRDYPGRAAKAIHFSKAARVFNLPTSTVLFKSFLCDLNHKSEKLSAAFI